jgi:AraC family transcriptional regulator
MITISPGTELQPLFSDAAPLMTTIVQKQQNKVVFSSLSEYYQPVSATGFSIKYVLNGTEVYTLNNEQFCVGPGSYLLSNSYKEGYVEIESSSNVKGICVTITPQILTEAVASYRRPDTFFPDAELGAFFTTPQFLDAQYDSSKTKLGKTLHQLAAAACGNEINAASFTMELFYTLSENIIEDQLPVFKQLQSVPSVKTSTKKELYKNIHRGREFIDVAFTSTINIEMVAQQACMSEYHFYRLFKKIMGITPHQYILQKRLQLGNDLLTHKQMSVTEAAAECGFSDVYSFSKAFKYHFGFSPSALLKK